MNTSSYTSASTLPVKLFQQNVFEQIINTNMIRPLHLQFNPTNKCNLNCSFCSCKNKDDKELDFYQIENILRRFHNLGTRAITITGGGEPLMHPKINEIIWLCNTLDIEVGLVTNGILLKKLETDLKIKWCRISISEDNFIKDETIQKIKSMPKTDWAFSYVLKEDKFINLEKAIQLASILNMTHIRVVDDILSNEDSNMEKAKQATEKLITTKVIWQGRKEFTKGTKNCYISLLKTGVDAHGQLFPCCGVQYAKSDSSFNYTKEFLLGDNYEEFFKKQIPFDGSICNKCYYSSYNNVLSALLNQSTLTHKRFV